MAKVEFRMKNKSLIIFLGLVPIMILAFCFGGCKKNNRLIKTIDGNSFMFAISPGFDSFQGRNIYEMEFKKLLNPMKLKLDNLNAIVLAQMSLEIIDTSINPYRNDVIKSGSFEITTPIAQNNDWKQLSFIDKVQNKGTSILSCSPITGFNLLAHAKNNYSPVIMKLNFNQTITHTFNIKAKVKYQIASGF